MSFTDQRLADLLIDLHVRPAARHGAGDITIRGAAAATYTPLGAGRQRHRVRAGDRSNATGPERVRAPRASAPSPALRPVNSAAPSVNAHRRASTCPDGGSRHVGGRDNVYTYQWQRYDGTGFVDITAATTATYTLTPADEDALVRVQVTRHQRRRHRVRAVRRGRPDRRRRRRSTAPPRPSPAPSRAGLTLTATPGTWSGVGNTYTYQWQRDTGSGLPTSLAPPEPRYMLADGRRRRDRASKVTATNPTARRRRHSLATGPVAAAAPVNTVAPTITGTAQRTRR